jgi:hypothetical protein
MIDTTTIISSSVMPRLLPLPAGDVGIVPFAARLAVPAQAENIGLVVAVLTR